MGEWEGIGEREMGRGGENKSEIWWSGRTRAREGGVGGRMRARDGGVGGENKSERWWSGRTKARDGGQKKTKIDDQCRCQPHPDLRDKEESNNICLPCSLLTNMN